MSKRGLGKGLDALLATSSLAREKQHVASHSQALSADGELTELAVGCLKPGVYSLQADVIARGARIADLEREVERLQRRLDHNAQV